jgi:SNF2 family DNA or RNA helicase
LIEQFSRRQGFGICILSPIAAGAGLNIVAANHIVHLERHWNPAREDQATDRAYRHRQTSFFLDAQSS